MLRFLSTILLYPFTWIYRFLFFLDSILTKKNRVNNAFVISVGNLSVGGTGKTPFVMEFIRSIQEKNSEKKITVLSRGYGGKMSKKGLIVELDSNPLDSGDEPLLIKKKYPDIEVIIGRNRFESYNKFSKKKSKIILLDDAFQHHALERNFDFVLVDCEKGLSNGMVIPVGLLRELPKALKRANCVVFTKYANQHEKRVKNYQESFLSINPKLSFLKMKYNIMQINTFEKTHPGQFLKGKKLYLFCGIGSPKSFEDMVRNENPREIAMKIFPDHHNYSLNDLGFLEEASRNFDFLICTEKDMVKIKRLPISENLKHKILYPTISAEVFPKEDWNSHIHKFLDLTIDARNLA